MWLVIRISRLPEVKKPLFLETYLKYVAINGQSSLAEMKKSLYLKPYSKIKEPRMHLGSFIPYIFKRSYSLLF